jgi:hypothetical protein
MTTFNPMNRLSIPEPFSGGLLLSYKCNSNCQHCMYACSPKWKGDWISQADAEMILSQLSARLRGKTPHPGRVGVNVGLHFTGGEPFLNFELLLNVTEIADRLEIPSTFVETNSFWCRDDDTAREKLVTLRDAGLDGILISANPFVIEQVPFERIERAAKISWEIFDGNVMIYQSTFYEQFRRMGLRGTLPLDEYLQRAGYGLHHAELLPTGRVSYKLGYLYKKYPAEHFFRESCRRELIRDWHIHIDNYCNFIPGYCAGLSLGDARHLDAICQGIDLDELPVLKALLTRMEALYELGQEYGYQGRDRYVSKCHLCLDVRRHLARHGEFKELRPKEFYEHVED